MSVWKWLGVSLLVAGSLSALGRWAAPGGSSGTPSVAPCCVTTPSLSKALTTR